MLTILRLFRSFLFVLFLCSCRLEMMTTQIDLHCFPKHTITNTWGVVCIKKLFGSFQFLWMEYICQVLKVCLLGKYENNYIEQYPQNLYIVLLIVTYNLWKVICKKKMLD